MPNVVTGVRPVSESEQVAFFEATSPFLPPLPPTRQSSAIPSPPFPFHHRLSSVFQTKWVFFYNGSIGNVSLGLSKNYIGWARLEYLDLLV